MLKRAEKGIITTDFRKSMKGWRDMSRNIHTGINPHRRPRNASNSKKRVAHAAAVVNYLNQAAKDENK